MHCPCNDVGDTRHGVYCLANPCWLLLFTLTAIGHSFAFEQSNVSTLVTIQHTGKVQLVIWPDAELSKLLSSHFFVLGGILLFKPMIRWGGALSHHDGGMFTAFYPTVHCVDEAWDLLSSEYFYRLHSSAQWVSPITNYSHSKVWIQSYFMHPIIYCVYTYIHTYVYMH